MRLGSVVYHCKYLGKDENGNEMFSEPKAHILRLNYMTIQPKSGNFFHQQFGDFKDYEQQMCCQPYLKWENEIKENDRFYLELKPDTTSEKFESLGYGYDANYKVVKRSPQNIAIFYALGSIVE